MIWRIRDRATFEALVRARRVRRGPLSLRYLPGTDDAQPRVAYAVGRAAGPAVDRNRIRRRLRAAIRRVEREGRLAPGAYLLGAGPEVLTMAFAELERTLGELVETACGGAR